jgi:hypothetical protein
LSLIARRFWTFWKQIPVAVRILWVMCALALPIWASLDDTAWDMKVYDHALVSLNQGHDPYRDATDIQKEHHKELATNGSLAQDTTPPYSYVYAPITLPLLKALGHLPRTLLIVLYWIAYFIGAFAAVAVCATFAKPSEYPGVLVLSAVAVFFPGLLSNGVILSGNIAYILYGAIFATALLGWRRQRWIPFYAAIIVATCVKAPLLSLVLIAPLSSRKNWLPSMGVIAAALGLYALQPVFMPALFRHYLEAVELQFSFNHDFGCSPAGLFSNILYKRGIPYSPGCYFVFAAYALPVFAALLYGARLHERGRITLQQWGPVLFVGVLLLNPRIMEYDAAPITLPLALIAWRAARASNRTGLVYTLQAIAFTVMNAFAIYDWMIRKAMDGPLILVAFFVGYWLLVKEAKPARSEQALESHSHALASA